MSRYFRTGFCCLACLIFLTNCRKKEWDAYYGRPSSLAPPIYQQLQQMGNFTHLLSAIDKAGYKKTLSKGGYWTMFAPDDAAFEAYFKQYGVKGDEGIDSATANAIVRYALVYNAYREAQLSDAQTSGGPDTSMAFKRKTAYYDWVYNDNGRTVIAGNGNGVYNDNDNNNKFIPYFLNSFLAANNLSAADYTFFYPGTTFTGFNVDNAAVVKADIPAENGLIDEVNKVILPLPSLENYLAANPDYSEFKKLLDKLVFYQSDAAVTTRNQALSGSADSVYAKLYSAALAFSPNNENYLGGGTAAQSSGWTLVVPTNEALIPYEHKILAHYKTFDAAPPAILLELLNAHMWTSSLWPSALSRTVNSEGEVPTFSLSDVTDKKVCSNGLFYGIKSVQDANAFRTVYGKAFLDPAYSLMTQALDEAAMNFSIMNPNIKYTLFMMSNNVMQAGGYDYDSKASSWTYQAPGGTKEYDPGAQQRLFEILKTSVAITQNGELDDLSGEGIVETWGGQYIRYKNNTVWASGNVDDGTVLHIDSSATTVNGKVYYTDGLLKFTEHNIGYRLGELAQSDPDDFSSFYNYLTHTVLWNSTTTEITGITSGNLYTLFVPTNAAISQAVKDGWLPGDPATGTPDFSPKDNNDQQKVIQFITYHFLNNITVVPDGKKSGSYVTVLKTNSGDATLIKVINSPGAMQLVDQFNDTAQVNIAASNNLSDWTVIHSINKVLKCNAQ
jgi:uncharacterized surface protein with fasciclin (FAS1) repeats